MDTVVQKHVGWLRTYTLLGEVMPKYDIYILAEYSRNGFGVAVISASPGESPYTYLAQWFQKEGFKFPMKAAKMYRIVDRELDVALKPGVISVATYYDGDAHFGRARPDRGGYTFDEGGRYGL